MCIKLSFDKEMFINIFEYIRYFLIRYNSILAFGIGILLVILFRVYEISFLSYYGLYIIPLVLLLWAGISKIVVGALSIEIRERVEIVESNLIKERIVIYDGNYYYVDRYNEAYKIPSLERIDFYKILLGSIDPIEIHTPSFVYKGKELFKFEAFLDDSQNIIFGGKIKKRGGDKFILISNDLLKYAGSMSLFYNIIIQYPNEFHELKSKLESINQDFGESITIDQMKSYKLI